MKYFTPELHARTCSLDDAIADAAHADWERVLERYEKHLRKIRPAFTPGLNKLTAELRLHDARLLSRSRRGNKCFLILRPEQFPARIAWLTYTLVEDPAIEHHQLPVELSTVDCLYLYDEIGVTQRDGQRVFTQSILFSDGMLLRLTFRDVKVHVADELSWHLPGAACNTRARQPA